MANPNGPPPESRGPAFSKDNQPANPGRPKGSRSRSTIIREILEAAAHASLSENAGELGAGAKTIVDQLVAAMAKKAAAGDVAAFNSLMDSAFGKLKEHQQIDVNGVSIERKIVDTTLEDPDAFKPLPGEPGHPDTPTAPDATAS